MKGSISHKCRRQVKSAAKYIEIEGDSPKQANILIKTFNEKAIEICKMPTIGMLCKNGMRKLPLGKFKYNIYYRVEDKVYFLGIHSMRRGKEFKT